MEDEPVIKPRRARGTPLIRYRNKVTFGLCAFFYGIHLITVYLVEDRFDRKIAVGWYDQSQYTREKRARMNLAPVNVGTDTEQQQYDIKNSVLRDYDADSTLDSDLR